MTASVEEMLAGHRFLAGLGQDWLSLLAGCGQRARFAVGTYLLREGDEADALYLIHEGRVAIEIHAPGRGPLVVETVGPGQVVGLSWVSPPYRWQFDAQAVEPVVAVAIDSACLRALLGEHPALGFALLERLTAVVLERLQTTRVRLLDLYGDGGGH